MLDNPGEYEILLDLEQVMDGEVGVHLRGVRASKGSFLY